ncbi:MAG: NADPH-dependent 7-cyano-7-deazaguanine reductase QueF [Desulfobacter sp.]|nr:MAG: NADPH-dependent 7-cyano-7-deazaguanine reductase QueF [Desulfobacter sp.]
MNPTEKRTIPLGTQVDHSPCYDPDHLFPVSRKEARDGLGISGTCLPFTGSDIWNAYELSWLDKKGKPRVALGELAVPCSSENIVESKSLKLYLNSFNQTRFASEKEVAQTIEKDLNRCTGGQVRLTLYPLETGHPYRVAQPPGECIDHLDIETDKYEINPDFLKTKKKEITETLYSNLLRTNCPVTRQPDWATVSVNYTGPAMARQGLLKYIISFRLHTGFHENCVERIFTDIMDRCRPRALTVYARFTRRGGIDINPFRTNTEELPANTRLVRQ